jgi:hypothetical protein
MTLAEFLVWEEQQTERHEFYRGETFAMVGGIARHNRVILYRALPSLREYVLIEPAKRQVEVFTLTPSGAWLLTDETGAEALTLAASVARCRWRSCSRALRRRQLDGALPRSRPCMRR